MEALADQRRRYLCYHVVENEPTDIDACAVAVAARELDCQPADVPPEERARVKATLYHQHLPKLSDVGVIEYDERTGDIRVRYPPPYFEKVLRIFHEIETDLPLVF